MGYELGDNALEEAFRRFKDLADKKKEVFDEDIVALVDDEVVRGNDVRISVKALRVECRNGLAASADLTLEVDGEKNARRGPRATAPVDATFNAIKALYPHPARCNCFRSAR